MPEMPAPILNDVSDTALWVAVYRDWENARSDALFRDPFAAKLAGDRGKSIESQMSDSRYVHWSVVIRTVIIDSFLQKLIAAGVDTVINLGAGLDSRPYRMDLPKDLRWVEVDFAHMITYKEDQLKGDSPRCQLERVAMDLSDESERQRLFADLNARTKRAVILTEGVTPYLSNESVAALARDLRAQPNFCYWITDYNSPELVKFLNRPSRKKEMRNAPFLFQPKDWFEFFYGLGWRLSEMRYIGEEAERLHRYPPHNLFVKLVQYLVPAKKKAEFRRYNGYAILEPQKSKT